MTTKAWKISTLVLALALGVTVGRGSVRSAGAEAQPHMQSALGSLQTALEQLNKATPDKGGHRVKAIALVNQAIGEVQKGINFDNKH